MAVEPLRGLRVMLTRSVADNESWAEKLCGSGAEVYCMSTIEQRTILEHDNLRETLGGKYDWLVFTSAVGVDSYMEVVSNLGLNIDASAKIAAVGDHTGEALRSHGIKVNFVPPSETGLELATKLPGVHGRHVLRVCGSLADGTVSKKLKSRGADVTDAVVYTTQILTDPDIEASEQIEAGAVDAIVFASPSGVQGFNGRIGGAAKLARRLPVVAIGPGVTAELEDSGFERIKTASRPSLSGVMKELEQLAARL